MPPQSKAILFACLLAGLGGCHLAPQTPDGEDNSGDESAEQERYDRLRDNGRSPRECTPEGACPAGPLPPPECVA